VGLLDSSGGRSLLLGSLGGELLSGTKGIGGERGQTMKRRDTSMARSTYAFPPVDFRAVCLVRAIVVRVDGG